jgi:hypothetical protein
MKFFAIRRRQAALALGIILACSIFSSVTLADTTRPTPDWLSAQGQDPNPWGGTLFVPPDPNYLGWADHALTLFTLIDHAGLAAKTNSLERENICPYIFTVPNYLHSHKIWRKIL